MEQVDRCTEITRNLLDFARKRDPVIQAVEVNRIIENMTMLVEKEAKHSNIAIVRHYDEALPVIYSDAPQLRQVILNFLYQCHAGHRQRRGGDHHDAAEQ